MLCVPVVHAVTIATLGPRNPCMIDKLPEIMLMMLAGIRNGESLRGPLACSTACCLSINGKPPMPEPMARPMRRALSSVISSPLSRSASVPATMP